MDTNKSGCSSRLYSWSSIVSFIYINDIVEDINSSIRLFADDTSLYIIVDDAIQAAETLNSDLEKISRWAQQWLVTFNPAKSESILFSRKLNKPYHPPVSMDETQINEVTSHKHLGVIFFKRLQLAQSY